MTVYLLTYFVYTYVHDSLTHRHYTDILRELQYLETVQ